MNFKYNCISFALIILFTQPMDAKASLFNSQEQFNEAFAKTAVSVFKEVNNNLRLPKDGQHPESKSLHWKVQVNIEQLNQSTNVAGKYKIASFVKSTKAPMSDALDDLIKSPSISCCRLSMHIVIVKSLQTLVGRNEFDKYVYFYEKANKWTSTLGGQVTNLETAISMLIKGSITKQNRIGYCGIIANDDNYNALFRGGVNYGENVILCEIKDGINKYIGFGPLFKDGPKTLDEIKDNFYNSLCQPSTNPKFAQYKDIIARLYKNYRSIFEHGFTKAQITQSTIYFDYHKINEIIKIFGL